MRAAWVAWHFGAGDLVVMKQRQLVAALDYVRALTDVPPEHETWWRRSILRSRLGKIDAAKGREAWPGDEDEPATEPGIDDATIDAAIASWPPKKGAPRKDRGSDWHRINALFVAFGCGSAGKATARKGPGEHLRVHLAKAGIYGKSKKP